MAIDSESKRASAMNMRCPWRRNLPFPDGTINQGDRQHTATMYSGILAAAAAAAKIIKALFSIKKPSATFTMKKPTATFTMKKPTATFTMVGED